MRPRTKVFCIASAAVYAVSILVPATMGLSTWMLVDIVLVPFLILIAYSVILGDRTPDGSLTTVDVTNSGGCDGSDSGS